MSNKERKHRVIVYNWIHGILHYEEVLAESFEHALHLAKHFSCFVAKIYDCDDILVHTHNGDCGRDSYA